jgi:hypothetical protein
MRHLIRNATLATLCALVLGLATVANATRPDRPIDSPEGPPVPHPTEVGDPDAGNSGLWANWRQLLLAVELRNQTLRPLIPATMRLMGMRARPVASSRVRR